MLFVAVMLSGCAGDIPAYILSKQEFEEYEKAGISFMANLPGVPDENETPDDKAKIDEIWKAGAIDCAHAFTKSIFDGQIKFITDAYAMHSEYKACAAVHGLVSSAYMVMPSGREVKFDVYIKEFENIAIRLAQASAENSAHKSQAVIDSLGAFAVSMSNSDYYRQPNSNILMVSPYITNRGTFVSPHIRTAPNKYCADNLRGCR
ncbi:MAG: hypothetical protein ACKOF9_04420 [Burkholderiales bacterium]